MLKIHIVTGRASVEGYHETYQVLENMEEKPKSYVGNGRRIDKDKIERIAEGIFKESYEYITLDVAKIDVARVKIKEEVLKLKEKGYNDLKTTIDNINSYNFIELDALSKW